jgi:hypothetical protein
VRDESAQLGIDRASRGELRHQRARLGETAELEQSLRQAAALLG